MASPMPVMDNLLPSLAVAALLLGRGLGRCGGDLHERFGGVCTEDVQLARLEALRAAAEEAALQQRLWSWQQSRSKSGVILVV